MTDVTPVQTPTFNPQTGMYMLNGQIGTQDQMNQYQAAIAAKATADAQLSSAYNVYAASQGDWRSSAAQSSLTAYKNAQAQAVQANLTYQNQTQNIFGLIGHSGADNAATFNSTSAKAAAGDTAAQAMVNSPAWQGAAPATAASTMGTTTNPYGIVSKEITVPQNYVPFANASSKPAATLQSDVPMASAYNLGITAINASKQAGATQESVQKAVSGYANTTYSSYNPIMGGVAQRAYVPEGNYAQQELNNVKIGFAMDANGKSTGEAAWYEQLPNGRMNIDPDTGLMSNWELIGGGGRNFLQSGTGGFAAATPLVYARGQVAQGGLKTPDVAAPGVLTSGISASDILANIKSGNAANLYSRLGAEAYGGTVQKLDNRILGNTTYEDVSNRAAWNFASYVNPTDVNIAKADLPGVSIPWSITDAAPGLFALTTAGGVGAAIAAKPFYADVANSLQSVQPLAKIVNTPSYIPTSSVSGNTVMGDIGLPAPFKSVGKSSQPEFAPSGFDMAVIQSPLPSPVKSGLIGLSDFVFGGRSAVASYTDKTENGSIKYTVSSPLPSGFDYGQQQFVKQIVNPIIPVASLPRTNTVLDYDISLLEGGYNTLREKPLTAAAYVGVGALFVAGGEVIAGLGAGTAAATSGTSLAGAANAMNIFATQVAPPVIAGLYAVDVLGRTNEWGKDFSPKAYERLGGVLSTETIPMILGGSMFANRAGIVSEVKNTYERIPSIETIRESVADSAFAARQSASGIERLSSKSGLSYYNEEPYSYTPPASKGISSGYNTQIRSSGNDIVTVPFERTILGSAYEVSRTNAAFNVGEPARIQVYTDILTTNQYGGVTAAQKTSLPYIDVTEYARNTGIDLQSGGAAAYSSMDVFRSQTIRESYPSGVSYVSTIGREATIDIPTTNSISLLPTRGTGIEYGQGPVLSKLMSKADEVLDSGFPKRNKKNPISPVDLPRSISELTVGYGNIKVASSLPAAAQTDTLSGYTRAIRDISTPENTMYRVSINDAGPGAKLGVALPGGNAGVSKLPTVSSLHNVLSNTGVVASEVAMRTGGVTMRGNSASELLPENFSNVNINTDISNMLYGKNAEVFGLESQRLREGTGIERMVKTGEMERVSGGITPLSKTFPRRNNKPSTSSEVKGKNGVLLLQTGIMSDIAKSDTNTIGNIMEKLKSKQTQESQPLSVLQSQTQSPVGVYVNEVSRYSPWSRRAPQVEEEELVSPSQEAMRNIKLGIYSRNAMASQNIGISAQISNDQRSYNINDIARLNAQTPMKGNVFDTVSALGIGTILNQARDVTQTQRTIPDQFTTPLQQYTPYQVTPNKTTTPATPVTPFTPIIPPLFPGNTGGGGGGSMMGGRKKRYVNLYGVATTPRTPPTSLLTRLTKSKQQVAIKFPAMKPMFKVPTKPRATKRKTRK